MTVEGNIKHVLVDEQGGKKEQRGGLKVKYQVPQCCTDRQLCGYESHGV